MRQLKGIMLLVFSLLCAPAYAEQPTVKNLGDQPLQYVAESLFESWFIDITLASLYVDPASAKPSTILDSSYSKLLVIEYLVDVSAEKMTELFWEQLDAGWSQADITQQEAWLRTFTDAFTDTESGEQYAVYWSPEFTLGLYKNDLLVEKITDPQAALMILGVWLGDAPISETQRDVLLQAWRACCNA